MTASAIVQYWHEERPPERIREGLASFTDRNAGLDHRVFNRETAERFLARHLSAREVAAFRACAVPAMQADYFRYCAVLVLGGLYADADLRCVRDLRPLIEREEGTLFGRTAPLPARMASILAWPYTVGPFRAVGNSPFAFREPGHPLLRIAVDVATANIDARVADGAAGVWLTAGPGVFTSMYLLHRLGSIDAFLEFSRDTALESSAPLLCEIVERHSIIDDAFTRVDIRPREREARDWVRPLPRRKVDAVSRPGWRGVEGSIFN